MTLKKTIEILYKPYSEDVMGYILRIADYIHIVINSCLSKRDSEKAENTLMEMSENDQQYKFILLQGDGYVYKTDNLEFLERAC